jgi:hypothetical protein
MERAEVWIALTDGGNGLEEFLRANFGRPAVVQADEEAVRCLGNNVHRMDYPRYVAEGWQLGSGSVESVCKTVVGQRLKLAGMHRHELGTEEGCQLRAWFKSESGPWDAFWRRSIN